MIEEIIKGIDGLMCPIYWADVWPSSLVIRYCLMHDDCQNQSAIYWRQYLRKTKLIRCGGIDSIRNVILIYYWLESFHMELIDDLTMVTLCSTMHACWCKHAHFPTPAPIFFFWGGGWVGGVGWRLGAGMEVGGGGGGGGGMGEGGVGWGGILYVSYQANFVHKNICVMLIS